MKDYDSISWIGGEGLPSRDQIKEKREERLSQVGFSQANLLLLGVVSKFHLLPHS
jgi:hypothetical protein